MGGKGGGNGGAIGEGDDGIGVGGENVVDSGPADELGLAVVGGVRFEGGNEGVGDVAVDGGKGAKEVNGLG